MEMVFQFTPLREGRPMAEWQYVLPVWNFNSRPSARGDPTTPCHPAVPLDFNSRPSARGDSSFSSSERRFKAFQFTPLREGRRLIFRSTT